ncbi:MAG: enolase C-terminal domain-like protein [Thermoplasmatota archaeon]
MHALYDLAARSATTSARVALDEPARMAANAMDRLTLGFRSLTLELGDAPRDVERAVACRRAAPAASLRAHANRGWSREDAKRILPRLVAPGIELVDQPLGAGDLDALAELSRESPIAIYARESVAGADDVERLAARRFRGGITVDVQRVGGLAPAVATLRAARERGYGTQLASARESGVSTAAASQLLALADLAALDPHARFAYGLALQVRPARGEVGPPIGPGLGLAALREPPAATAAPSPDEGEVP